MKNKAFLTFVLCIAFIASAINFSPAQASSPSAVFVTTITVNTGKDFSTSLSESCTTYPTVCSLRRAIVQARLLDVSARPVLIQFNIPATADEGYDAALQVWKLNILTTTDQYVFRDLAGGQITLDGSTQPGGRANHPKIILVGPGTGNKNALNLSNGNNNVVRGLAFQNFRVSLTLSSGSSLIEKNWFGLTDDGSAPAWRDGNDHSQGSGYGGLEMTAAAADNTIQNNVFLGIIGNAATIRGNHNIFSDNYVGTNINGLTPGKQTDPSLLCTPVDWFGGSGILVDGPDHVIGYNVITGIRLDVFESSSQPDAIWVESTCDRCVIQNNKIGVDSLGHDMGVCGIGIDITNGEQIDVLNNEFAETYRSAIFLNGSLYKDNKISGNLVRRSTPWLAPEGSAKPDDAILRYSGLPDAFESFNPAKVTSIQDLTITGTAGDGNPCPNCIIEIFLDDDDGINEALQFLGSTTANASGNWSFTLPFVLGNNQGLRTSSTTASYNTIPNMDAGTTAGLSVLYRGPYYVYIPIIKR
jgi:hypothetical protein